MHKFSLRGVFKIALRKFHQLDKHATNMRQKDKYPIKSGLLNVSILRRNYMQIAAFSCKSFIPQRRELTISNDDLDW